MVNPGACKTSLTSHANASVRLQIGLIQMLVGRSAEVGSRTLLHGLSVGEEAHGRYLSECEISEYVFLNPSEHRHIAANEAEPCRS